MKSEIEGRARFDIIRYSQVWEDADLLIQALDIKEDDVILSIASAGDNAFSLLAQNPAMVYAVDLSDAQIACCELRKAMYRQLSHPEHLLFGGVVCGKMDRAATFQRLDLPPEVRAFWQRNISLIEKGFMTQGKFERYFALFREKALPLVHTRREVERLLISKSGERRGAYYDKVWNNRRWQALFRLFFSRFVMGRLGRDKEFFKFVEGSVADKILARTRHALCLLDPSKNPYLHFILNGAYAAAFPFSLREENYERIRGNLDKITFRKISIERFVSEFDGKIGAFNLSDIFEYMSQEGMDALYETILQKAAPGARLCYWNMLAPRRCSPFLREKYGVSTDPLKNAEYLLRDKAFFYSKFYLDKVK